MGNSLFRFGGAKTAVMASISPSPKRLGWRMPAEWERHSRTHMVVPFNNAKVGWSNWWHTNWRHNGVPAQEAHSNVVKAIAQFEPVTVWTNDVTDAATRARIGTVPGVTIKRLDTEDAWVRDYGPTFLVKEEPTIGRKQLGGVWWTFNAWGGIYDPVNEREVAGTILRDAGAEIFRTPDFVLEGGSIHVDGEGTVLTTEECLLNANRNPHLTKPQIEEYLREYLGADKVNQRKNVLCVRPIIIIYRTRSSGCHGGSPTTTTPTATSTTSAHSWRRRRWCSRGATTRPTPNTPSAARPCKSSPPPPTPKAVPSPSTSYPSHPSCATRRSTAKRCRAAPSATVWPPRTSISTWRMGLSSCRPSPHPRTQPPKQRSKSSFQTERSSPWTRASSSSAAATSTAKRSSSRMPMGDDPLLPTDSGLPFICRQRVLQFRDDLVFFARHGLPIAVRFVVVPACSYVFLFDL